MRVNAKAMTYYARIFFSSWVSSNCKMSLYWNRKKFARFYDVDVYIFFNAAVIGVSDVSNACHIIRTSARWPPGTINAL